MVKLGYLISYVDNVEAALTFFEQTFAFKRRLLVETGDYGELESGDAVIAFAAHSLGRDNLPAGYVRMDASALPLGMELALVCDDLAATHQRCLQHGAAELQAPAQKPWGQTVSYLRTPFGLLLELCTPL